MRSVAAVVWGAVVPRVAVLQCCSALVSDGHQRGLVGLCGLLLPSECAVAVSQRVTGIRGDWSGCAVCGQPPECAVTPCPSER